MLVAADLTAVALHPRHDLLQADSRRPGVHQRPDAHPDPGRDPDRAAAGYRRRAAGGVPKPLRHRAEPGARRPGSLAARPGALTHRTAVASEMTPSGGLP